MGNLEPEDNPMNSRLALTAMTILTTTLFAGCATQPPKSAHPTRSTSSQPAAIDPARKTQRLPLDTIVKHGWHALWWYAYQGHEHDTFTQQTLTESHFVHLKKSGQYYDLDYWFDLQNHYLTVSHRDNIQQVLKIDHIKLQVGDGPNGKHDVYQVAATSMDNHHCQLQLRVINYNMLQLTDVNSPLKLGQVTLYRTRPHYEMPAKQPR